MSSGENTPVCRTCGRSDKLKVQAGIGIPDAVIDGIAQQCITCNQQRDSLRQYILYGSSLRRTATEVYGVFRLVSTFRDDGDRLFSGNKWEGPLGGELYNSFAEAERRMHDLNRFDDKQTFAVFRQFFEITSALEVQRT